MIQIYTGNGKGETTASIGQGVRAAGRGFKVYMVQFLKGTPTGELESLKKIDNFKVFRFEEKRDFVWNLNEEEIEELKKEVINAYNFILEIVENKECDLLIMDEIMGVLKNGFLSVEDIIEIINRNKHDIEIIMTGRDVPKELADRADLITEMNMVKHYYEKGVPAREGIEY